MSKGLEQFDKLKTWYILKMVEGNELLLRNNEKEMLYTIGKELKALEIIKNKQVQINRLNRSHSAKQYNLYLPKEMHLTQEEYELLKEVLS